MLNQNDPSYIFTLKEAARALRISDDNLLKLRKAGKIETVQLSQRFLGIRRGELDRYLTQ
jgi:excisionase family DNA binding protein